MKNKEELQGQIEDMKQKLAEMEALLTEPEVSISYWQPEINQRHWYVGIYGNVKDNTTTLPEYMSKGHHRVFKTKAEAQKYAEYIKAEETLKRVIAEANAGVILDWNHPDINKYEVYLNKRCDRLYIECKNTIKYFPSFMYIKSRELAEKLIEEYETEFKTYLSY